MLRPACLLPAAQLSPLHGLLTPRSGTEVSLHCLGPATRRTDAYRDGTLTRGSGAACNGRSSPVRVQLFLCVTTNHAAILDAPPAAPYRPRPARPVGSLLQRARERPLLALRVEMLAQARDDLR